MPDVIVTCVGGPLDGKYEFPHWSPDDMPDLSDAMSFPVWIILKTTNGEVGRGVAVPSPQALSQASLPYKGPLHAYCVSKRHEDGQRVHLEASHLPNGIWQDSDGKWYDFNP